MQTDNRSLSKWGGISLFIAFVLFLLPYLTAILLNKPLETQIDSVYLSGFITASGILFGFIGSVTVAKHKSLEYDMMFLVTTDFLFFVFSIIQIFLSALEGKPTLFTLSWITGSLLSNSGTVIILMKRIRLQEI